MRMALDFGPLVVWAFEAFHAHHLASMGLWRLAVLVAKAPDLNDISWAVPYSGFEQSPLMVAVQARWPAGRGADGKVEWAHALGDEEVARMVRAAVGMGVDVNRQHRGAWPLMTYCAARGCLEAVKACLAAGAEVDAIVPGTRAGCSRPSSWWTALLHAARVGHEAVVAEMLEAGASVKIGPEGKEDALLVVCDGDTTPGIVRRLVEAGANIHYRKYNRSALTNAARRGNLAVMDTLAELGARVARTKIGRKAMEGAAIREVVRWLAARGVSVQGHRGEDSPLHYACEGGRVDVVRALIELGADVNRENDMGQTPLTIAVQCSGEQGAVEMTRLLLEAGADANAMDEDGCAPLDCARHEACKALLRGAGAYPGEWCDYSASEFEDFDSEGDFSF